MMKKLRAKRGSKKFVAKYNKMLRWAMNDLKTHEPDESIILTLSQEFDISEKRAEQILNRAKHRLGEVV